MLLDYGDVVVHVQHAEERVFYALERLWKDCPFIPFTDAAADAAASGSGAEELTARRLVLLRHGRTAWNAERRFQGQADPPLDEVGRAQAYEVAGADRRAAPGPARQLRRAARAADRRDRRRGDGPGRARRAAAARARPRALGGADPRRGRASAIPDEYADWVAGRDVSRRGGETRDEVAERALAAFDELPDVPTPRCSSRTARPRWR